MPRTKLGSSSLSTPSILSASSGDRQPARTKTAAVKTVSAPVVLATWLTKHEAAEMLQCSTKTLERYRKGERGTTVEDKWLENAHFTWSQMRGQWLYNKELLLAWNQRQLAPHQYTNALQTFIQLQQAG